VREPRWMQSTSALSGRTSGLSTPGPAIRPIPSRSRLHQRLRAGVRENGGQYTHAAVWTAMAFAALGDGDRAWELLSLVNPINHSPTPKAVETYKVDRTSSPPTCTATASMSAGGAGRGTRAALAGCIACSRSRSSVCGWKWTAFVSSRSCRTRGITQDPLPLRETFHHISIRKQRGKAVTRVVFDGAECPAQTIPLIDDRQEHNVDVEIG